MPRSPNIGHSHETAVYFSNTLERYCTESFIATTIALLLSRNVTTENILGMNYSQHQTKYIDLSLPFNERDEFGTIAGVDTYILEDCSPDITAIYQRFLMLNLGQNPTNIVSHTITPRTTSDQPIQERLPAATQLNAINEIQNPFLSNETLGLLENETGTTEITELWNITQLKQKQDYPELSKTCCYCNEAIQENSEYNKIELVRTPFQSTRYKYLCSKCIGEGTVVCKKCGTTTTQLSTIILYTKNEWDEQSKEKINVCETCYTNSSTCYDCQEIFSTSSRISYYDDNPICETCAKAKYKKCSSCSNLLKPGEIFFFDDISYCSSCIEDVMIIHRRPSCPSKEFFQKGRYKNNLFQYDYIIGAEFEGFVDKTPQSLPQSLYLRGWGSTRDTSIKADTNDQFAFELISPPMIGNDVVQNIRNLKGHIDEYNIFINESCGFHVHIGLSSPFLNVSNRNEKIWWKARKTAMLWLRIEPLIHALIDKDRLLDNTYCHSLRALFPYKQIARTQDPNEFRHLMFGIRQQFSMPSKYGETNESIDCNPRYGAINFNSLAYRGSIEFRCFQASLESEQMLNWIKLCCSIVATAQRLSDSDIGKINSYNYHKVFETLQLERKVKESLERTLLAKLNSIINMPDNKKTDIEHVVHSIFNRTESYESAISTYITQLAAAVMESKLSSEFDPSFPKKIAETYLNTSTTSNKYTKPQTAALRVLKILLSDNSMNPILNNIFGKVTNKHDQYCMLQQPLLLINQLKHTEFDQIYMSGFTSLLRKFRTHYKHLSYIDVDTKIRKVIERALMY